MIRPRDFAKMVQAAKIVSSDIVLDIACGRGYSTAILAQLSDTVVGLESNEADVARATDILIDAEVTNAAVVQGNLRDGAAKHGPFDVIFVNGAIPEIPEIWTNQLVENGRLVCLIQSGPIGQVRVYTKISNTIGETIVFDASAPTIPGFEKEEVFDF
jgi:protein-L-isoaspartate(D-aspartate) O-methyltransferase